MQGKKKESTERKLYTGFTNSTAELVCPTNEELREIGYNIDDKKEEIEYVKDKEGVTQVRIDFHMKEITTGYMYKRSFFLEDRDVVTKIKDSMTEEEIEDFVPKSQYVNQIGDSFYSESASKLSDFFTKFQKNTSKTDKTKITYGEKKFRVAKVGEADLMAFIRTWLNEFDYWDADTNILLNTKKLFNGDFSEIQEHVGGEWEASVVDTLGVKLDTKDGERKEYQDVYKTALPGERYKVLKGLKITKELAAKWRAEKYNKNTNPKGRYLKDYEQLVVDMTDPQYPWSREFELTTFKEYDSSKSFAAGDAVLKDGEEEPVGASKVSSDDSEY